MKEKCKVGDKVYLIDDLGDSETMTCTDTITAVLIEKNRISVKCKTSGNEFWVLGESAFFSEFEAKKAFEKTR